MKQQPFSIYCEKFPLASSGKWGPLIVVNRPITLHKPIQGYRSVAGHLDFALSEPQQGVQGSWPDALVPGLVDRVRNRPIRTNRIVDERLDGLSSGN